MEYKKKFRISKEELHYYSELLSLDLSKDMPYYNEHDIERLNAKQNDYIGIGVVEFENGNYLTLDLASGDINYYDNFVLFDKNGNELLVFDCCYNIDTFFFDYGEDSYIVEIETF